MSALLGLVRSEQAVARCDECGREVRNPYNLGHFQGRLTALCGDCLEWLVCRRHTRRIEWREPDERGAFGKGDSPRKEER